MTKDYAVEIRVRNGRLLAKMRQRGIESAAQLSRDTGVHQSVIGNLLALKAPAVTKDGEWRRVVVRISDHLRCLPADIIPHHHVRNALKTNRVAVHASADDVAWMIAPLADSAIGQRQAVNILCDALRSLDDRTRFVLEARFGLTDGAEQTYDSIAKTCGVTQGRIRQIECRGLRKLQSPRYRRALAPALDALAS